MVTDLERIYGNQRTVLKLGERMQLPRISGTMVTSLRVSRDISLSASGTMAISPKVSGAVTIGLERSRDGKVQHLPLFFQ